LGGIFLSVQLSEKDFPKISAPLSVYKVKDLGKKEIQQQRARLISDLGFSSPPKEKEVGGKKFLVWEGKNRYLSVEEGSDRFYFSGEVGLSDKTLSSETAKSLIKEKLVNWGIVDSEVEAEVSGYLREGGQMVPSLDLASAEIYQISFSPTLGGYSIYDLDSASGPVEVRLTQDGKLLYLSSSLSLHRIDQNSKTERPLKTFNQTNYELQNGQGELVRVLNSDGQNIALPLNDQIEGVQIYSVKIVYYETAKKQLSYEPVFLFQASISLKNSGTAAAFIILQATED
jgi:hypothetical protein